MATSTAPPRRAEKVRAADMTPRPRRDSSSVDKLVMGVTGAFLIFFVLFHLAGNLKLFLPKGHENEYAEWLHNFGQPLLPGHSFLWLFRGLIGVVLALHVFYGLRLAHRNAKSRPVGYAKRPTVFRRSRLATFSGRTMWMTGCLLLVFLAMHILDQVVGKPVNSQYISGDPENNVISSLNRIPFAVAYSLVFAVIAVHLLHGVWSIFTSFGLRGPRIDKVRLVLAWAIPAVLLVGNLSIVVAIQAGWVS